MNALMPTVDCLGVNGQVTLAGSKYARNIVLSAVHHMGGVAGLVTWAKATNANEADFWTKIFPKTVQREVEVEVKRDLTDVLVELDMLEGEFTVVPKSTPTSIQEYPIVEPAHPASSVPRQHVSLDPDGLDDGEWV